MKLALLGTGKIVKDALIALQAVPDIEIKALWAREHSLAKAQAYANEYHIKQVTSDYASLLEASDIDCIYIGLINSVHFEYAKQALLAGKNVIVEKPFCPTLAETQALIKLAKQQHCFLFDAVSFLYMPNYQLLVEKLAEIGKVRLVLANYSQYSSRYDDYLQHKVLPAFDPKLYGGALYDINFYNITLVTALFGAPQSYHYQANIGFNGVDTSGVMLLKYADFTAVCTGAKDADGPSSVVIEGEKGYVAVKGAPNTLPKLVFKLRGQPEIELNANDASHRMTYEFKAFAKLMANNDYEAMTQKLVITENVIKLLASARDSIMDPQA